MKASLPPGIRRFSASIPKVHSSQIGSLTDSLIEVDKDDNVLGAIPKLDAHLADAVTSGKIHRAFSVFLFSERDHSLLIQKRSSTKIVFPREWANTCCSHPLFHETEMENVNNNHAGVKRAAVKRLDAELGIKLSDPFVLTFKEKILYKQLSPGGVFGESECDYILMARLRDGEKFSPNVDEVESFSWIPPGREGERTSHLREFLDKETSKGFPPTPWFDLMVREKECLESWWGSLIDNPDSFMRMEDVRKGIIRDFIG